jgi:PadR family transcriptional regulator, regulatory protein PadR
VRHEELWRGLIRLHVLHHAAEGEVFGLGIIRELRRHGYDVSPGTMYPILHRMERAGYLVSRTERSGRSARKSYRATRDGRKALEEARRKVRELFAELVESVDAPRAAKRGRKRLPGGARRQKPSA